MRSIIVIGSEEISDVEHVERIIDREVDHSSSPYYWSDDIEFCTLSNRSGVSECVEVFCDNYDIHVILYNKLTPQIIKEKIDKGIIIGKIKNEEKIIDMFRSNRINYSVVYPQSN